MSEGPFKYEQPKLKPDYFVFTGYKDHPLRGEAHGRLAPGALVYVLAYLSPNGLRVREWRGGVLGILVIRVNPKTRKERGTATSHVWPDELMTEEQWAALPREERVEFLRPPPIEHEDSERTGHENEYEHLIPPEFWVFTGYKDHPERQEEDWSSPVDHSLTLNTVLYFHELIDNDFEHVFDYDEPFTFVLLKPLVKGSRRPSRKEALMFFRDEVQPEHEWLAAQGQNPSILKGLTTSAAWSAAYMLGVAAGRAKGASDPPAGLSADESEAWNMGWEDGFERE